MDRPTAIALLGLGEAGSEIARDLVALGADVRGYDPRVAPPPGVLPRPDEAAAVADADLVLSVNSAADAPVALRNALPRLRPGAVWADLNTAAPAVKRDLAAAWTAGVSRWPTWRCSRPSPGAGCAPRCWCPARVPTGTPRCWPASG